MASVRPSPESGAATARVRSWSRMQDVLERSLAALILCFGLWTIINTGILIVHCYSPVMFWDHWDIVRELMRNNGHITWSELWAQHNEHRPVTGRLLYFADLFWFGGRNVSLLAETFLIQTTAFLTFATFIWRAPVFRLSIRVSLIGFAAYCCFASLQVVNFIWAFQTHFVLGGLFGILAVALAAEFRERYRNGQRHAFLVFNLCLGCALLAELSLASGLLTWPVLFLLTFAFKVPRSYRLAIGSVGALATALYFVGYRSPEPLNLFDAFAHPLRLIQFVSAELAWSWDGVPPNQTTWPHASHLVVLGALLTAVALLWRTFSVSSTANALAVFLAGSLLFSLGSISLTALGRSRYGFVQAIEGRYQSMVLAFWAVFSVMAFSFLVERFPRERWLVIGAQGLLAGLLLYTLPRNAAMAEWGTHWRINQRLGWNAALRIPPDAGFARLLYPNVPALKEDIRYLQDHHWGPRGPIPSDFRIKPGEYARHLPSGYTVQTSGCGGVVDGADGFERSRVHLWGWAYQAGGETAATRVVIADSQGRIMRDATARIPRPDVPAALPTVKAPDTGWQVDMNFSHGGSYFAFALNDKTHQACVLHNGIGIR